MSARPSLWRTVPAGMALAALAATAGAQSPASPAASQSADPAKLYQDKCDFCHGGGLAPMLVGRGLTADAVKTMVRSGRGDMPAFAQKDLPDPDLAGLADWISKNKPSDGGK